MLLQLIASFVTSLGFALLFNIRGNKLKIAVIIGCVGGTIFNFCLLMNYSKITSLFISSMIISILSEISARLIRCPVTVFLHSALIQLVPGAGMYYTMLEVVKGRTDLALAIGTDTVIEAFSIVFGCVLISSAVRMIRYLK